MMRRILICLFVIFISAIFVNLTESKCLQKNTNREAHRDSYLCKNQYFEPGQKIPDPENCECYYDCNYRQQPCYTCCPNGQVFHPKQNVCVLRNAYRSCRNQPPKYRCEGSGLFLNREHCRKYWDCSNNIGPVEEACPEAHHWDDSTKVCRKDTEVSRNLCNLM